MDSQCRPPLLVLQGWQCCPCRGVDLPWWGEGAGQIKSGLAHHAVQACPWCSAQMVATHTLERTQANTHTFCSILRRQMWGTNAAVPQGARPLESIHTLYLLFFFSSTHISLQRATCAHTHSPQRSNQPSPPPLSLRVFLHHLILAVCMWIIHHSLNQSIEFHLVRCYTGHVIDSLVPFHWSLNDIQCCLVDACTHTHVCGSLIPCCTGSPLPGGRVGCRRCQRRPLWDWLKVAMSSWLCQHLFRTASRLAWAKPVDAAWPWINDIKSRRGKHDFFFFNLKRINCICICVSIKKLQFPLNHSMSSI